MAITDQERARSRDAVDRARDAYLEGQRVSETMRSDQEEYVERLTGLDVLGVSVRARYGFE